LGLEGPKDLRTGVGILLLQFLGDRRNEELDIMNVRGPEAMTGGSTVYTVKKNRRTRPSF